MILAAIALPCGLLLLSGLFVVSVPQAKPRPLNASS